MKTQIILKQMTVQEYQDKGKNLLIEYSIYKTRFGICLVASSIKGICTVLFGDTQQGVMDELFKEWKNSKITKKENSTHTQVKDYLNGDNSKLNISLHVHGTDFQIGVWNQLLTIPKGSTSTYRDIATQIGNPKAFRAVGNAIGKNPIGYIIPCHRVIKSTGEIGEFKWGIERKIRILKSEGTNLV